MLKKEEEEKLLESKSSQNLNNEQLGTGKTGLANLGNTCFMNSALQCLINTEELNIFLDTGKYKLKLSKKPEALILCEWDNLRKLMWSEDCTISPGGFVGSIQKVARIKNRVIFTGFSQNDLTEFLNFLTECFHTAISREVKMNITGNIINNTDKMAKECYEMMKSMYKKEYSEFLNMFFGIHVSEVKSNESDYLSLRPEPFFNIHLPIPNKRTNITIENCFDLYTSKEDVDGVEVDETTKKRETCSKCIKFWSLPDVLVITLKRFGNNQRKNQKLVHYPIKNLNLTKYVVGYDKESYIYELYGICNHSGNVGGGHYTSNVKCQDNKWYLFNDTSISEIKNLATLVSPKAYCFFYRKQKK
jgi:ubiquitin C-terminal hydrolase